jgi:hypothetical protein
VARTQFPDNYATVLDSERIRFEEERGVTTIYVALLNDGTPAWRPVSAEAIGGGVFRIPPDAPWAKEDEEWEFLPGERVRCEQRVLSGNPVLVAVERAAPAV